MGKRRFKAQFDKRPVSNEHFPCDDMREGDGVDPKLECLPKKHISNRKALQLCAQVFMALSAAFSGAIESTIQELQVESVIPAPDSSQLLVSVIHTPGDILAVDIMDSLQKSAGYLRHEVAKSITRKRVPQLKYRVK